MGAACSSKEQLPRQHLSNEHCQQAAVYHEDTRAQRQGATYRMWHEACLQQQACRGPMLAQHLSNRLRQQVVRQNTQDTSAGCKEQVQHAAAESGSTPDQVDTATMQRFSARSNMYKGHARTVPC